MKRKGPKEIEMALHTGTAMNEEQTDAAAWEVTAMVYVGDVYPLMAAQTDDADAGPHDGETGDSVWPFIR